MAQYQSDKPTQKIDENKNPEFTDIVENLAIITKESIKTIPSLNQEETEKFDKRVIVHIFTDSTGETTLNICTSTMSQFPTCKMELFSWPFMKTTADIDIALESVFLNPGIVIYSIMPSDMVQYLKEKISRRKDIKIIPALDFVIRQFGNYLNIPVSSTIGREQSIDKEYQQRMEAIQYTVNHDDGRAIVEGIEEADIVIIGVSRTAKTPTCLYLANRGLKVMNIPYISDSNITKEVYGAKNAIIVGLMIDPNRLLHLRRSRVLATAENSVYTKEYTNIDKIEKEISDSRYFFGRLSCPVVDVTDKSVEEISTQIIKIWNFVKNTRVKQEAILENLP